MCLCIYIDLARTEEASTIFSYLSGMYGWILDGISSLFEPVTARKPTEWPAKGNVSKEASTRPGVKVGPLQQENQARAAKRNYQRSDVWFFLLNIGTHFVDLVCIWYSSLVQWHISASWGWLSSLATKSASITKKLTWIIFWDEQKKQ